LAYELPAIITTFRRHFSYNGHAHQPGISRTNLLHKMHDSPSHLRFKVAETPNTIVFNVQTQVNHIGGLQP
jgi:hypothetical protein